MAETVASNDPDTGLATARDAVEGALRQAPQARAALTEEARDVGRHRRRGRAHRVERHDPKQRDVDYYVQQRDAGDAVAESA